MHETVENAWAKINLALHVTGQRSDGYHTIESLVTFAQESDVLRFRPARQDQFEITGPFARAIDEDSQNLVVLARDRLRRAADTPGLASTPVAIQLEKNLPVAAGIGGGSADAAACLRGLSRFWQLPDAQVDIRAIALMLGADVPMCLVSRPLIAGGIGETITPLAGFPSLAMVLVNPLVGVSTPQIFAALKTRNNAALPPKLPVDVSNDLIAALQDTRNDLETAAEAIAPVIGTVKKALWAHKPLFVRMSGSGATCFALFDSDAASDTAAQSLRSQWPQWYVCHCTSRPSGDANGRH